MNLLKLMQHKKYIVFKAVVFCLSVYFFSNSGCRNSEIVLPLQNNLRLSVDSVTITTAKIHIQILDTIRRYDLAIRNNRSFLPFIKAPYGNKITYIDSTLLRGKSYSYKVYRLRNDSLLLFQDSSNQVTIHTIDSASVSMSVVDIGIHDAEFHIQVPDHNALRGYSLIRDRDTIVSKGYLSGQDTVLVDASLMPNTLHQYTLYRLDNIILIDSSATINVRTLDTTNHFVTWQVDTLGAITSVANDVAILDDQTIWVTGRFYDSISQVLPENLAKWDGTKWTLERVTFSFCISGAIGDTEYSPDTKAIIAFSPNDVWICPNGLNCVHWDGVEFHHICGFESGDVPGEILKLWGTSSGNLYAVGRNGRIDHYNGVEWQGMPSGTTTDLLDVWGSPDGNIVWASGWVDSKPTVLLKLDIRKGNTWEVVYDDSTHLSGYRNNYLSGGINSVWTDGDFRVFALSFFDLYKMSAQSQGAAIALWGVGDPNSWAQTRVRGTAENDIFVAGYPGRVLHYNGSTWKSFPQLETTTDNLYGIAVTSTQVVAVGERYDDGIHYYAVVNRGRR